MIIIMLKINRNMKCEINEKNKYAISIFYVDYIIVYFLIFKSHMLKSSVSLDKLQSMILINILNA